VTVVEWAVDVEVPVTVTVYTPDEPEQDRVAVAEVPSDTVVGDKPHVGPDGDTDELSDMVPVKAFNDCSVMVEVTETPAFVVTLDGLAAIEKSGTWMLKVTGVG